jgi:hypothetical protein
MENIDVEQQLNNDIINFLMKLLFKNNQVLTAWIISLTCTIFNQLYTDLSIETSNSYSNNSMRKAELPTHAAKSGNKKLLQLAFDLGYKKNKWIFQCVAFSGNLKLLKDLFNSGCPYDMNASEYAVKGGNENILQWMEDNDMSISQHLCTFASTGGHIHLLKKLRKKGYVWDSTIYCALRRGHKNILEWALNNGCPWTEDGIYACDVAAKHGKFDVLRWLAVNGYYFDKYNVVDAAINHGHINIIEYFIKYDIDWLEEHNGRTVVLKEMSYTFCSSGKIRTLEWIKKEFGTDIFQANNDAYDSYFAAIENESVSVIRWLLENNITGDIPLISYKVSFFSDDLLKWIKSYCEKGNIKSDFIDELISSIERGSLENDWICIAGKNGHISVLDWACKYAYNGGNNYPENPDESIIMNIHQVAVKYGYASIIKYH